MKLKTTMCIAVWGLLFVTAATGSAAAICPTAAFSTVETGGPPGNQPYITAGGGCNVVITFAANGSVTTTTPNPNSYDGVEDTLVGIVNNTSTPLTHITLTSTDDIFGFDGDGICFSPWAVTPCNNGPTGYEGGVGVSFSGINAAQTSGTVNFDPAIPGGGGTNFFSLEGPPSINISVGGSGVPEPSTFVLIGLMIPGLRLWRNRSHKA